MCVCVCVCVRTFLTKYYSANRFFTKKQRSSGRNPIHSLWIVFQIVIAALTASVVQWSEFLATDPEDRVRFLALPEKESSGSGTGSTQRREYNWGATW
jgi:heme/copper-type cytochrome/quinol oxidase subunit 2